MRKHKIIPVVFPWSGETKYKLAIRQYLFGIKWLGYWVFVDDIERWDSETGSFRVKWFNSEEEALNYVKTL